jgi:hypothetical protein
MNSFAGKSFREIKLIQDFAEKIGASMKIDDLRGLVEQRSSIRGYDQSRDVSDEIIRAILDCARWAPSGGNGQPWEFIIIRNKETRNKIADYYLKQMEPKREMDLAVRGTAKMTGDGFRHAPIHIVILGAAGELRQGKITRTVHMKRLGSADWNGSSLKPLHWSRVSGSESRFCARLETQDSKLP